MEADAATATGNRSFFTSTVLEFAANDDLSSFKQAVESGAPASSLDFSAPWYSRSVAPASSLSRRMCYANRTPAMIAALYGSTDVLTYILSQKSVNVNNRSPDDGATALHFAASGGSPASLAVAKLLITANADVDAVDAAGNRPGDVIAKHPLFSSFMARDLELLLKAPCPRISSPPKKEYPPDLTLPDIKNGIYGTDEFRMYTFKVKPCSRAYSHDWTECPFVHPGENARRRDPRKYSYSCVPCPDFRKGSCLKADSCEYAHGVFECWLHPAQYRTRLCKDEIGCNRRVCFFAHKVEELRMVNPTAASVAGHSLSSPRSSAMAVSPLDMMAALMIPTSRLKSSLSARDLDFDLDFCDSVSHLQNMSLKTSIPSSPTIDHSFQKGIINSRPAAGFAMRSQSFIDRAVAAAAVSRHISALSSPLASPISKSDWGSPDGRLDWGIQGDELNKLRKSATFDHRINGINQEKLQQLMFQRNNGGGENFLSLEQLYADQELMQMAA